MTQKILKVLSGLHAGASLPLQGGRYRLAGDALDGNDNDTHESIALVDWRGPPAYLRVEASGDGAEIQVRLRHDDTLPSERTADHEAAWPALSPQRVGGLVLCIGNSDAEWPADADLLALLDRPQTPIDTAREETAPIRFHYAARKYAGSRTRNGIAAVTFVVGAGLMLGAAPLFGRSSQQSPETNALGTAVVTERATVPRMNPGYGGAQVQSQSPRQSPPQTQLRTQSQATAQAPSWARSGVAAQAVSARPTTASNLLQALKAKGLTGLSVQESPEGMVVTGFVLDAQENDLALEVVRPFVSAKARAGWDIAEELISTIDAALRAPGARTRYAGAGRFVTEGIADSPDRVVSTARQLRRDLGSNLKDIQVAVTAQGAAPMFSSGLVAGRIRYDDRRDGTRRFDAELQ